MAVTGTPLQRAPDWSPSAEAARFLDLAAAQVEVALREGEADVNALTAAFAEIGAATGELQDVVSSALVDPATARLEITRQCDLIQQKLGRAVVAFQFFDRLNQRLQHVQDALQRISGLVDGRAEAAAPGEDRDAWERLREHIRSTYSMEHERLMFDLLIGGASADEVLLALNTLKSGGSAGHVDLF